MKRPRYLDFVCQNCNHREERFVETNDDNTPIEEQRCTEPLGLPDVDVYDAATPDVPALCEGPMTRIDCGAIGYMKTITKGNHDFNDRERERLEKRGDDHWKREGRHEAIERERAMLKKNGMEGAGGVK